MKAAHSVVEYSITSNFNSKIRNAREVLWSVASGTKSLYKHFFLFLFLFFFFFYSCCSHLEHRAFVKRFVSLRFLNLRQSVGLSPLYGRYLTQIQIKSSQTSMSLLEFEPTIPVFQLAKTFHILERAATVICKHFTKRNITIEHSLGLECIDILFFLNV
jgi:hypothetical protein